jgi:hypothetical protein
MSRTINSARNPRWANAAQTRIDLEVDFDELDEVYVPFTAEASDPEEHGRTLFSNASNGDYGPVAAYVTPETLTGETALSNLRVERTALLKKTDYIEMPTKWASLTAEQQAAWTTYRNALRDLPANSPNAQMVYNDELEIYQLTGVTWPTVPE